MRYFLWVLLLCLGSYPALALDQTDFPIQVYINPYSQNNDGTLGEPLPSATLAAFRQAVLDWNRMLSDPPHQEDSNKALLIVLKDQRSEADLPLLNMLGLFWLTDDPNQADLVVQGINSAELKGFPGAVGSMTDEADTRIGEIDISIHNSLSTLQLRTILLHELGHALGLGHISNTCNLMSTCIKRCVSRQYRPCQEDGIYCVALLEWQIAKVNAQLNLIPGHQLDPHFQDQFDYQTKVDNQIKSRIYGLGDFSTPGRIQIVLTPEGKIQNVKITRSFGDPMFEGKLLNLLREFFSFGPFPASYQESTMTINLDLRPNSALQSYIKELRQQLKQGILTLQPPLTQGTLALTISDQGELREYKFTGEEARNLEVKALLSHIFPLKPAPGLHKGQTLQELLSFAP